MESKELFQLDDFVGLFSNQELENDAVDDKITKQLATKRTNGQDSQIQQNLQDSGGVSPNDKRLTYLDSILVSLNLMNETEIAAEYRTCCREDLIFVSCWLNQLRSYPRCLEIHGIEQAAAYTLKIVYSVPDLIVAVKERKLYIKPDGSSFLAAFAICSGCKLLDVIGTNMVRYSRQLFAEHGFVTRVYRLVTGQQKQLQRPLSTAVSTSLSSDRGYATIIKEREKVAVEAIPFKEGEAFDEGTLFTFAAQDDEQLDNNEMQSKQKKRQQSMPFRKFFASREQKISPEQIEVATQTTDFLNTPMPNRKPVKFQLDVTFIIHIDAEHKVFKAEVFRKWNSRVFLTLADTSSSSGSKIG